MHAEDFFTAFDIRQADGDLTVEAARAKKRGIEHIRTVGRGDDDDAFLSVEAIHLNEQGIESLFTLIVTSTHAMTAVTAHGVDFINEDEAGGVLLALFKHVAHTAGTDTHEHFHKIRSTDAEEWHIGLASDCFGEERLACARGADHEHAFGDLAAETLKLLWIPEELDEFGDFLLGLFNASHIFEGDLVAVLGEHFGPAFAKAHGSATCSFDLLANEEV